MIRTKKSKWRTLQSRFNIQQGFWKNKKNQRDFMDQLGNRLGYKEINAWYGITKKTLARWDILLDKYGDSPSKLVMTVYDTHQWQQSHFNATKRLYGSMKK